MSGGRRIEVLAPSLDPYASLPEEDRQRMLEDDERLEKMRLDVIRGLERFERKPREKREKKKRSGWLARVLFRL